MAQAPRPSFSYIAVVRIGNAATSMTPLKSSNLISLGTSAARGFFQINRNFGEAGGALSAGPGLSITARAVERHGHAGNVKELWSRRSCA
jgi:hypothetical protein